jgi:hypothetical protein
VNRVDDPAELPAALERAMSVVKNERRQALLKVLSVDGEGSFTTRGTIKDGHPVPTNFMSKIVSNAETSDVAMVLDEGSVRELAAAPKPLRDHWALQRFLNRRRLSETHALSI